MNFFYRTIQALILSEKPMTIAEIEAQTLLKREQIIEAIRTMAIFNLVGVIDDKEFYLK